MFEEDRTAKAWGVGGSEGRSVFSPMIVFPIIAMVCYFAASWTDLVFLSNGQTIPEWNMKMQ